jgi:hypothetical protein
MQCRLTVLRASRNCACTLLSNLLLQLARRRASVYILGLRWLGNRAIEVCMCGNKLAFALIPCLEDFGGGRAA